MKKLIKFILRLVGILLVPFLLISKFICEYLDDEDYNIIVIIIMFVLQFSYWMFLLLHLVDWVVSIW